MIEDAENTSVYLQKHLQHDVEGEEEEERKRRRDYKKIKNTLAPPHTLFTLLHTKHAALELLQYSTIFIILEKAEQI